MSREIKARRIAALFGAGDLPGAAAAAADAQRQHPEDARFPRLRARALFDGGSRNDGLSVMEARGAFVPQGLEHALPARGHVQGRGPQPRRGEGAAPAARRWSRPTPMRSTISGTCWRCAAIDSTRRSNWCARRWWPSPTTARSSTASGGRTTARAIWARPRRYLGQAATRLPRNSEVQDHLGRRARQARPPAGRGRCLDARARGRRHATSIAPRFRRRSTTRAASCGGRWGEAAHLRDRLAGAVFNCPAPPGGCDAVGGLRALCLASSVAAAACAPARLTLPTDTGSPLPDLAGVHAQVSRACRGVRTFTAELALSGHAGRTRLRGRVVAGFERPASMRLEGVAPFGAPAFILVARDGDATLLLPRDDRVLTGASPEDVLGASPACRSRPPICTPSSPAASCPTRRRAAAGCTPTAWPRSISTGGATLYLTRVNGAWQPRAASASGVGRAVLELAGRFSPQRRAAIDGRRSRRRAVGGGEPARSERAARCGGVHGEGAALGTTRLTLDELREAGPLRDAAPAGDQR